MTQIQLTLKGERKIEEKTILNGQKPWIHVCCKRCWYAKSDKKKCRCRCHGVNHQEGLSRAVGTRKLEDVT